MLSARLVGLALVITAALAVWQSPVAHDAPAAPRTSGPARGLGRLPTGWMPGSTLHGARDVTVQPAVPPGAEAAAVAHLRKDVQVAQAAAAPAIAPEETPSAASLPRVIYLDRLPAQARCITAQRRTGQSRDATATGPCPGTSLWALR